jgi:hypothetical protein
MFVFIPVDGWPKVVDAEPSDDRLSDELGAIPFPTAIAPSLGLMIHEDQPNGLGLNVGASYVASLIIGATAPVFGPACLALIDAPIQFIDGDGMTGSIGACVSLPAYDAQMLAEMAAEALHAEQGNDDMLRPGGDNDEFSPADRAALTRGAIALIRAQGHERQTAARTRALDRTI